MILAHYSTPSDDFEYTDSKENYLLRLLDGTGYSPQKKARYEAMIQAGLEQAEFESLLNLFYTDQLDPITMRGGYNMGDLHYHLKKLIGTNLHWHLEELT